MEIRIELPGVKLGVLEADDVSVVPSDERVTRLIAEVCRDLSRKLTLEALAESEPVRAVRAMFRGWGVDPSKYRPSSEALMRRVIQGKGLYRVSTVVDVGNLGSVETGWPFGLYDRSNFLPPVIFRHGLADEIYEGIGKRALHLEGRPVLVDSQGPFGSPISDSTRTMITETACRILAVIYAPVTAADPDVTNALNILGERLQVFATASSARTAICRKDIP